MAIASVIRHRPAGIAKSRPSFDHLVGTGEQHRRNVEPQRTRRPLVDDELELGRLQHREVGGLYALGRHRLHLLSTVTS